MKKQLLLLILISFVIMILFFFKNPMKSKEEVFWNWFSENQLTYYNGNEDTSIREKIFNDLSKQLKKVNEGLVFEFSPIHKNGIREFTISADGIVEVFPYVTKLVNVAPKIKNWQINAFRQRNSGDDYEIKYGEIKISYSDLYFRYTNDSTKIGLELNIKNFDGSNGTKNAIYILLDCLIGEYDMETQISWIEWNKLDELKIDSLSPIIDLRQLIDKRKEEN